jgi:hypothetical protein
MHGLARIGQGMTHRGLLLEIGEWLRVEYRVPNEPLPERLKALVDEFERLHDVQWSGLEPLSERLAERTERLEPSPADERASGSGRRSSSRVRLSATSSRVVAKLRRISHERELLNHAVRSSSSVRARRRAQ